MTNAELYELLEAISAQAVILVTNCDYDRTRINDSIWDRLVELVKEVEDYV